MKRTLKALLAFVALGMSAAVCADTYRVGIIETISLPIVDGSRAAFTQELTRLMPEDEFEFVVLNAQGSSELANDLVTQVVNNEDVDLLVTVATLATRAAFQHPQTVAFPMVFMTVADPVGEGIVDEFGQTSAKNITGESHVLEARVKLDMLDGLLQASDVAKPVKIALIHTTYPSSTNLAKELLALDSAYDNVEFVDIYTPFLTGENALQRMSEAIVDTLVENHHSFDGYWLSTGPLSQVEGLVSTIYSQTALFPIFAESIESVKDGALLGVVSDVESIGQSAANTAKRVLEGATPNTIPVKRMDKYAMAVNVSTAIALNMPIPSAYLKLAKRHVYQ